MSRGRVQLMISFAPGPLPGYAGNPDNNNEWIEADMPLLGALGVVVDEPMEDIAMLFGDDDFSDEDSEGVEEEKGWEVGGPSTAAAEGPSFPFPAPGVSVPPSVIEDLSTRLGNLKYGHGQFMKKVIHVSDAEIDLSSWHPGGAGSADCDPERWGDCWIDSAGAGFAGRCEAARHIDSATADYGFEDEQPWLVLQIDLSSWHPGGAGSADCDPERWGDCWIDSAGAGFAGRCEAARHIDSATADYGFEDEQP
nr:hypothetical protein [Tanacetum cinerariifolium]